MRPPVRILSPPATRQCEPLLAKLQALVRGHHCEPSILHMSSSILLRTSSTGFEEGDDDDEAFAASWSAFSLAACSSFSFPAQSHLFENRDTAQRDEDDPGDIRKDRKQTGRQHHV